MSKFFRALEQAKRDRALRSDVRPEHNRPLANPSPPVVPFQAPATSDPEFAAGSGDGMDEHLVSLVAPAAFEAEQYRALRHIVEQLHRTAELKVIAVSSPGVGDGKTVTSINLAGALAQGSEARVLLIDADLRRPALGRLLGLGATGGADLVGGILDPRLTLEQIVQPRPPFNLSVVCAGQTPPSPYEVLKSARLGYLIEEARRQYDFVVIDTPPLGPVQDCLVIGHWVDGFLLVVAAHRTPRRMLEESLAALDHSKILGIVFNQDDRRHPSRYGGYSGGSYTLDQPSAKGGPRAALGRAVKQIGNSFRRHQRSAKSAKRRSARSAR